MGVGLSCPGRADVLQGDENICTRLSGSGRLARTGRDYLPVWIVELELQARIPSERAGDLARSMPYARLLVVADALDMLPVCRAT